MNPIPCFLSEFHTSPALKPQSFWSFSKVAFVSALCAGLAGVVLASIAKTGYLSVLYSVISKPSNAPIATYTFLYGFLAEPNWGPFYVFLFPFCIYFGITFLIGASGVIESLQQNKRLTSAGTPQTPVERIARLNQVIFGMGRKRGAILIILAWQIIFALCLVTQLKSLVDTQQYNQNNFWDFGQTQSPNLGSWESYFNSPKLSDIDRLSLLNNDREYDNKTKTWQSVKSHRTVVDALNKQLDPSLRKLDDIKDPKKHDSLHLVVAVVPNQKPSIDKAYLYYLLYSQALVAFLFTFSFWIAAKGLFFWGVILSALFQKANLQLTPKLKDPTENYGLIRLRLATRPLFCFCSLLAAYILLKTANTMSTLPLLDERHAGAGVTLWIDLVALIGAPFIYYFIPKAVIVLYLYPKRHPDCFRSLAGGKSHIVKIIKEIISGPTVLERKWEFNLFMTLYGGVVAIVVSQAFLIEFENPIRKIFENLPWGGQAVIHKFYDGGIQQDWIAILGRNICWNCAQKTNDWFLHVR